MWLHDVVRFSFKWKLPTSLRPLQRFLTQEKITSPVLARHKSVGSVSTDGAVIGLGLAKKIKCILV